LTSVTFLHHLHLHRGVVNKISYAPELQQLATCSGDGTIKILDTNNFKTHQNIKSHNNWIDDISFTEDILNFFTIGRDNSIKAWRTSDYTCLYQHSIKGYGSHPFSYTGQLIVSQKDKRTLTINHTIDGMIVSEISLHTNTINAFCFSNHDKFFITAHNDATIKIWSPWTGDLVNTFVSNFSNISTVVASPNLELICAGSNEGQINIWLTGESKPLITHFVSSYKITAAQFSSDNQFLFCGDLRGDFFVIDISTNKTIFQDSRHGSGITCIAACGALAQVAAGSSDGSITIFSTNYTEESLEPVMASTDSYEMVEDELSSTKLQMLISKSDAPPTTSKFKVLSNTRPTIEQSTRYSSEDLSTRNNNTDSEVSPPQSKKNYIQEWKIGDPIDEMLTIFGYTKGGMGSVYFLRHRTWQVKLAMKSPLLSDNEDESTMQRFIREATTWISLGVHPHIASCYFVKKIEGIPRIFIEYIDNGTLYDWIYKGKINSIEILLKFATQFCMGIQYAHRRGVIHRDIKPSNCLIDKDENLKITDFGLVKMAHSYEEPIKRNLANIRKKSRGDISTDNCAMGTPEYMSPEQWEASSDVGAGSDIYSFGIMLFEMACSRRPFLKKDDDGLYKMLQLHSFADPPNPTNFLKTFPPSLKRIILRCIEKDISKRYQNFNDILFDLKNIYKKITNKSVPTAEEYSTHINPETKNNYSISLLELGFDRDADEMLTKAHHSYPNHFQINFNYYLRQWQYHQLSDTKFIEFVSEQKLRNPDSIQYLQNYIILLMYHGKYQEAITMILEYENYKNSSFLINLLAISHMLSDDMDEGMKAFVQAAQVAPPGPELLLSYSSIFYFSGNHQSAKELYEKVCSKYPNTYKNIDPQGFKSEHQIMKSLLIAHHPGLPLITKRTKEIKQIKKGKKENIFFSSSNKGQFAIWCFDQKKVISYELHSNTESLVSNGQGTISNITPFHYKQQIAIIKKRKISVHDLKTQEEILTYSHPINISKNSISPKDSLIVILDIKNNVVAWDIKNDKQKTFPITTNQEIINIAVSYQENYLGVNFKDGDIKIYSIEDGEELISITPDCQKITTFDFLDESTIIIGDDSGTILMIDTLMGITSETFKSDLGLCKKIIPHRKENPLNVENFIVLHENNYLSFWQKKDRKLLSSFKCPFEHIHLSSFNDNFVAYTNDHKLVNGIYFYPKLPLLNYIYCKPSLNASAVKPEKEFDVLLNEASENIKLKNYSEAYISIKESLSVRGFARSQKAIELLYKVSPHGELKNLNDCWYKYHIPAHMHQSIKNIIFEDNHTILFPLAEHLLKWELNSKETKKIPHSFPIKSIKTIPLNNDVESYIFINNDYEINIWDVKTKTCQSINVPIRGDIISFDIIGNNNLICLDHTGQAILFDIKGKKILLKDEFGVTAKQVLNYKAGNNILIRHENFLQIYSLEQNTILRNFKGSKSPISSIAFSQHGRLIAQTNLDGDTSIWNAFTSEKMTNIPFDTSISNIEFAPNSNFIAIGDYDGYTSIVDINTSSVLFRHKAFTAGIKNLKFTDNGQYLIGSGLKDDQRFIVYEMNWDISFAQN